MKLCLEISTSPDKSVPFEHGGPKIAIGRDPSCELHLEEGIKSVSWRHAIIELTADGAFLRDLESTNGTFVSDKRIEKRTRVESGDHIRLGQDGPYLKLTLIDISVKTDREKRIAAGPSLNPLNVQPQLKDAAPDHGANQRKPTLATRMYVSLMESRHRKLWIGSGIGAAFVVLLFGIILVIQGGSIAWLFGETTDLGRKADKLAQQGVDLEEKIARANDTAQRATQIAENMGKKIPISGPELYQKTLRSCVLIWCKDNNSCGSGCLIDRKRGLIITAYHVVAGSKKITVAFPCFDSDGKLIGVTVHRSV